MRCSHYVVTCDFDWMPHGAATELPADVFTQADARKVAADHQREYPDHRTCRMWKFSRAIAPKGDQAMSETYELWNRFTGNLILDGFASKEAALDFARQQITGLTKDRARAELDAWALTRGAAGEVRTVASGPELFALLQPLSRRG